MMLLLLLLCTTVNAISRWNYPVESNSVVAPDGSCNSPVCETDPSNPFFYCELQLSASCALLLIIIIIFNYKVSPCFSLVLVIVLFSSFAAFWKLVHVSTFDHILKSRKDYGNCGNVSPFLKHQQTFAGTGLPVEDNAQWDGKLNMSSCIIEHFFVSQTYINSLLSWEGARQLAIEINVDDINDDLYRAPTHNSHFSRTLRQSSSACTLVIVNRPANPALVEWVRQLHDDTHGNCHGAALLSPYVAQFRMMVFFSRCPPGSLHVAPIAKRCRRCRPGHKCPPGAVVPVPCPVGTFAPNKGSVSCSPCEAGSYQDEQGKQHCKPCPENYQCPSSAMTNPTRCTRRTFSRRGARHCTDFFDTVTASEQFLIASL